MRDQVGFGLPLLGYLEATLRVRVERARTEEDRGASAIEWVVIAAVVVGIVLAVGVVISRALTGKAESVESCIGGATNSTERC